MQLDEEKFIELLFADKPRAFNMLIELYSSRIYNTCLNLVRNREDAEDLTQEVFTSVYLSLEEFNGRSKISTWVYGIALNKSKEFLRNKTRKKRSGIHVDIDDVAYSLGMADFQHPGILLDNKEQAQVFFHAIDQLPDNQKFAYTMHKIQGMSYTEVADNLDVSISSVESLMFRAKKGLQKLLEDYYKENFG